jgi:hypothetical protein
MLSETINADSLYLINGTYIKVSNVGYEAETDTYSVMHTFCGKTQKLIIPARSVLYFVLEQDKAEVS